MYSKSDTSSAVLGSDSSYEDSLGTLALVILPTNDLLRGIVSLGEAKSSICKATAYQPLEPVAAYRRVHCNTEDNSYNKCVMEQHSRV